MSPQVPHDYDYLRAHINEHHPELLVDFEEGWSALSPGARELWSDHGTALCGSTYALASTITKWDNWANTFRIMWGRRVDMMQRDLQNWRANRMFSMGRMTTWKQPDVQAVETNVVTDVALALDGYYLMHEWNAYRDFEIRWKDEKEREKLWTEIVQFWRFQEVFPKPPTGPCEFQKEQGWMTWPRRDG
jgi:hypothetical protein